MTRAGEALRFEPLYYADRIHVVNSLGDVGVLTLWTPLRTALRLLERLDPTLLDPAHSRVAAVANLYGDGMHQLLANLAHNPQVRHLVAVGNDRGLPTCAEIEAFLARGLEPATLLGARVWRIPGTSRVLPELPGFDADDLRRRLTFRALGGFDDTGHARDLPEHLATLPPPPSDPGPRVRVVLDPSVPAGYRYRPSEAGAHQVVRDTPLECWTELVTRAVRFGRPVELGGGQRLELLNTVVVVREPVEEPDAVLQPFGFSREAFDAYQRTILDPTPPEDAGTYTYGNRLRGHFRRDGVPVDSLTEAAAALRRSPNSRQAYVTLWDPTLDQSPAETAPDGATPDDGERPCLVSLAFRRSGDTLALTATYRAHNLLTAWLQNVYGLIAVQRFVADRAGMTTGPLTVVSHSLGIDPASPRYPAARALAEQWHGDEDVVRAPGQPERRRLREDPNGHFVVTADHERGEIVAQHLFGGLTLKEYRGRKAATIERQLLADMAVSLVSHALWLGGELRAKQAELEAGPGRRATGPRTGEPDVADADGEAEA